MDVKKVIIPAAGLGTRLYPLTKSIPKVMLPVGLKPMIHFAVEEALLSGIEEICIVVGSNSQSIRDYFDIKRNTEESLSDLLRNCEITFMEQPESLGIADAISRTKGFVGDACFGIIVPDTLFFSETPGLKQILDVFARYQIDCSALVALTRVEELQRLGNYGFVDYEKLDEKAVKITKLYPKGEIPGSFGIQSKRFLKTFGRSVNTPELFDFIEKVRKDLPHGAELDDVPVAQRVIAQTGKIGCILKGEGFDVGSLSNYQDVCSYLKDFAPVSPALKAEIEKDRIAMKSEGKINMTFSVVIPVFNEVENLRELYERLTKVMPGLGVAYEVIFVDDGSEDESFALLKELHDQDERVMVIRLSRNFGQPAAISAGLKVSSGEYVVVMDADLQNPPEDIPKLIREMEKDYDIVYGLRRNRKDSFFRRSTSKMLYWYMTKFAHVRLPEGISAFRVMNRRMVEHFNMLPEKMRLFGALSSWLGARYTCVDVEHSPRKRGKSGYNYLKLLRTSLELQVAFSAVPLRWIGMFGILISLLSFCVALYLGITWLLFGTALPGYTSIIVAIIFFSGLILISLSVIGEYISRIYTEIQNRPIYVVRETLGCNVEEEGHQGRGPN